MLIYQLDAYIFKDELDYWCNKSYDYIGAPWFENYSFHEKGFNLWKVGNGGFSLRKISWFIKVLSWKLPVKKIRFRQLLSGRIFNFILYALGRNNTMGYYIKNCSISEDAFFTISLMNSWIKPYLPELGEAIQFSFEKSPKYLMNLNNNRLPMGCHAFNKYEYDTFWIKYIDSF